MFIIAQLKEFSGDWVVHMDKLSWLHMQVILTELTWEVDINIWRQMVKPQLWHERTQVGSLRNLAAWGYERFGYAYWGRVTQMVRRVITLQIGMINRDVANVQDEFYYGVIQEEATLKFTRACSIRYGSSFVPQLKRNTKNSNGFVGI